MCVQWLGGIIPSPWGIPFILDPLVLTGCSLGCGYRLGVEPLSSVHPVYDHQHKNLTMCKLGMTFVLPVARSAGKAGLPT